MEKFTFKDLKEAISKLTDDQLTKEVYVQREEEAVKVNELFILEEDIYYNEDDPEDRASLADLKELHGNDFDLKDYKLGPEKGTPFLAEDF